MHHLFKSLRTPTLNADFHFLYTDQAVISINVICYPMDTFDIFRTYSEQIDGDQIQFMQYNKSKIKKNFAHS